MIVIESLRLFVSKKPPPFDKGGIIFKTKRLRRVIFAVGRTSLIKSVSFAPNGIDYFVVWVDCEKLLTNTVDMHGYR